MATNNALNTPFTGQTGTGSFVGSLSPTLTTPNIGDATATTLTFTSNTNGIIGSSTGANSDLGIVGEVISFSVQFPSAIALTSNVVTNLGTVALTPGDWDVEGNIFFTSSPGAITTHTTAFSTVSATFPNNSFASLLVTSSTPNIQFSGVAIPFQRFSVSVTTVVFAVVKAIFSSGSGTFCGNVFARRVR